MLLCFLVGTARCANVLDAAFLASLRPLRSNAGLLRRDLRMCLIVLFRTPGWWV